MDFKEVKNIIEDEGFDYAFTFYSDFEEVDDPHFHVLRKEYISAAKELDSYIQEKIDGE